jgi:Flp pilus assembly protein TadD
MFVYGTAIRGDSIAAGQAAERAIALAPTAAEGYEARGWYQANVERDTSAALATYKTAVRLAPGSAVPLLFLAGGEEEHGHTDSGLALLRRAAVLDPRSPAPAHELGLHFLVLRRYPEARAEFMRALADAPSDLDLINLLVMSYLGQGDLRGAHDALQNVPLTLDRRSLVANIAHFYDYWVLDSADRALLMTLPLSSFGDNRCYWGIARAQGHWLMGDTAQTRAWADTARRGFEAQLRNAPSVGETHGLLGLMLAYLGQGASATREIEKAGALAPPDAPPQWKYSLLASAYMALGDTSRTLDALEQAIKLPGLMSAASFRIDPTFASLHGNTRFERLVADTAATPHH